MNIAIIIFMILSIIATGSFSFTFNDGVTKTFNCNWCALVALILFLVKYIFLKP